MTFPNGNRMILTQGPIHWKTLPKSVDDVDECAQGVEPSRPPYSTMDKFLQMIVQTKATDVVMLGDFYENGLLIWMNFCASSSF